MQTATKPTAAITEDELAQALAEARYEGRMEALREVLGPLADLAASFERVGTLAQSLIAMERTQRELAGFAERDLQVAQSHVRTADESAARSHAALRDADDSATGWRRPVRLLFNPEREDALDADAELDDRRAWANRERRRSADYRDQLDLVREAVDAEVGHDHPLRPVVETERRGPTLREAIVSMFETTEEFVARDERRKSPNDHADLAGHGPYGGSWLLESWRRPWVISEYAIFWNPETKEVFARTTDSRAEAEIYALGTATGGQQLMDALNGATSERMGERNSLVWASENVYLASLLT